MYITTKTSRGRKAYYAMISKRVNGKPRVVWQKYLGAAETIVEKLDAAPLKPEKVKVFSFGCAAALYSIWEKLDAGSVIDRHSPKRDQGPSVSEYLLVAALNRCIAPCAKNKLSDWYEKTALPRILGYPKRVFSSQNFWNNTQGLDKDAIRDIERELAQRMVNVFQLDLRTMLFDATNFATYIDSDTSCSLPQRGKNKQKRNDLRQVSLALLASVDFGIPLFHDVYAGNINDSVEFNSVSEELVKRHRLLCQETEHITLVIDKGNNSRANIGFLADCPYSYVGSLVPSHHRDLLAIPLSNYEPLDGARLAGVRAYRTSKKVFRKTHTIVVTHSGQTESIC